MNRGDIGLVLGLAGFILGGVAVFVAGSTNKRLDGMDILQLNDDQFFASLGERVEKLDLSHKELAQRVSRAASDPNKVWDSVHALEARLEKLEKPEQGGGLPLVRSGEITDDGPVVAEKKSLTQQEFEALRDEVFDGNATDDEEANFWEAAKAKPELLTGMISDLEKKVTDAPRDIDARMSLASAYITKLYTGGFGPEAGIWAGKAEKQWKAVLDVEPNHRDAHFSLGTSYSFYPDQFNKRPDAIREFEAARKIQEASTPDPQHAQTYVQLRQLYLKEGKADEAKAVVEEGLRRFPDDANLKKLGDGAK